MIRSDNGAPASSLAGGSKDVPLVQFAGSPSLGKGSSGATARTSLRSPSRRTGITARESSIPRLSMCLPESSIRTRSVASPSPAIQSGQAKSLREGSAITLRLWGGRASLSPRKSGSDETLESAPPAKCHLSQEPFSGAGRSITMPPRLFRDDCREEACGSAGEASATGVPAASC